MKGKIKRLASICLVAMMLLSFLPTVSAEITGEGTEASPYLISSVSDLQAFAADVNSGTNYSGKVVKLTASLDLTGINWTPIGKTGAEFKGTFDGGHHVIKGLSINSSASFTGFFGRCVDATIKNLGIENAEVTSTNTDTAILVANTVGGRIENCYVTGSANGYAGVGGIIGSTHGRSNETVVENCYVRASLSFDSARGDCAGISGWNYSNSIRIVNCYSACIGEVRPIAGWSDGSSVSNDRFANTYFDKTLSPDFSADAGRTDLGKTSDELKTQSTFTDWDFTDIWAIDEDINGGYPYLQGFDGVTLSGAPGTLTVILTYESGDKITDATVTATGDNGSILELAHQADGIYSSLVPNTSATYAVSVNGEAVGDVAHNGRDAVEKSFELQDPAASVTYSYAYDAQRSPAFPASKGSEIKASSFANPLKYGANSADLKTYDSNAGTWTLTEVGSYAEKLGFTPAPTSYLDGIVNIVADKYGLDADGKNGLIIHKLTDENDERVAYGLIISVDEDKEYALFIGDVWNNSGAGYLLSNSPITDSSVTFNTDKMVQSTYSVSLSTDAITFDDAEEGYSAPSEKSVTITNTGDVACGALEITASGSSFTLNKSSIADIAVGGSDTFTVVPKTGLAPGTYNEEITISGDKIMPETLNVSFKVTAHPTCTVSFAANGGSGTMADVDVIMGSEYTLPSCSFTAPTGKEFAGWDKGNPGDKITVSSATTITAQWKSVYKDYSVLQNDIDHVRDVFGSLAEVTEKNGAIVIKLLSDINGKIRFDQNDGNFVLDLNGKTVTPGTQNEALCVDNAFTGTVTVTGEGTLRSGTNNIIYTYGGTLNFAVSEGNEYFSLKNGSSNIFEEKNTETKRLRSMFTRGESVVLTQGTLGTYTVSFNANGGSGTMAVQTVKELTETALSANTFVRSGYNFTGWNKLADGSGTAYADKASVKDLAASGGSITLYAQWTKIPAAAPSVSTSNGLNLTYGAIKSTDTISVLATSDASTYDLSYQWYKDGSAISGATSASYTIPENTAAGAYTYYCKVTATRRDNGLDAKTQSGNIAVNVAKASVAVPSVASKVYTGATLKADISDTADYTVTQNNGGKSAGSYDVVLTLVDSANYKWADGTATAAKTIRFSITKSNANAISGLTISGWTYGDAPNAPSSSSKFGTVTYKYAGVGSTSYNSATVPSEAGTYKVIASVAETNDYNGATAEKEFTIAKAQAVITVDTTPIVKTYGEALTLPTASTNFGTVTVDKTSAELKSAGTYTVTYKVSETGNWKGDTKTVDVTINKKPVEILWGTSSFVYDGNEKTVTAEISNAVDADVVVLTLSGNTATNAGDYTASAVALDNANYTLDGVSATKAWEITQATNEWTNELSISDWTYGDAPDAPSASAKFGDVVFTYSSAEDGTYESEVPTDAGTWYVKAEVYGTSNFTGISAVKSFIIEKAVPTVGEAPKTIPLRVNDKVGVTKVLPGIILGADGEEITGTYSWENPGRILDRDSSYTETLIFTPEDTVNYEVIEFDATINTYTPSGLIADGDKTKPQPAVPQKPSGEQESSKLFDDVPVGIWFEEAAEWMGKNGYMSGTASRTFSPYIGTSRGMVVTVLWRIAGSPEPNGECPFEDVPKGSYYETAITWAQENGVVTGHSDTIFKPDDLITREQLAAIIYRNEVRKGMEAVTLEENLASFADAEKVSAYAIPAMNWAVGEGLMNGVSGNTLAPQKDATRAETATIIYRMENK